MKIGLISGLALGACASVALAEPASTAAGPTENATIEAHATGPITLSEAEMDRVAAGYVAGEGDKIGLILDPISSASGLPTGKRQHKPVSALWTAR